MKALALFSTFLLAASLALAQYNTPQNFNWVFGRHVGIDFSSGTPTSSTTAINSNESCASVSNKLGQLLFYTDGVTVYNRLNIAMPSGTGIVSYSCNSTTQGALIVPSLSNPNQYYIFSLEEYYSSPTASRLSYSIVDTSLASGLGDLVPGSIGVPIASGLSEKMVAVASTNCSVWIIVHNKDVGKFYAYELTSAGLSSTPVTSTVGTFSSMDVYAVGTMAASPDGRHLVCNSEKVLYAAGCEIYDFDPATGVVSNCRVLNNTDSYYGAEFSPDSKLLYTMNEASGAKLYQYDISLSSTAAIIASGNIVFSSSLFGNQLKLGPDNKIYTITPGLFGNTLDVINNPNVYGLGCNYVSNAVSTGPNATIFGLPSTVITVVYDSSYAKHDTFFCLSPGSSAAIFSHFTGSSYVWNDGSNNISRDVSAAGTYWVAIRNGCSVMIDTIHVATHSIFTPDFSPVYHLGCGAAGDRVDFTNLVTTDSAYTWDFGDGTPTDTNRNMVSHIYAVPGIYSVTLTGSDMFCERDTMITIDTRHSIKANFITAKDTICTNELLTFNDLSFSTAPLVGYVWNFKDLSTDYTIGNVGHSFSKGGIYSVTLTIINSIGCVDSATRNLFVLDMGISSFHDTTICLGNPIALNNVISVYPDIMISDSSSTYSWNPHANLNASDIQIPSYYGLGITTYTFTATLNRYGCSAVDTIRIRCVPPVPLGNVTPDITIAYGESIQLNADGEIYYHWFPADGTLDNANIKNPIAHPQKTTVYTVYSYDINSCLDSAFVNVVVDSTMTEFIPSAFTPNGDGMNDVFRPVGLKFQTLTDFRVFNRWGQQVFYSNNYKNGWNGTFNNELQDLGVYSYVMVIASPGGHGDNIFYKGNVTLIR